jgi:transposase
MPTQAGVMALFIKTTRAKGYEYIKLVESYKENGKPKHRVLYNFGRADLIKKDPSFLKIVKRLCEIAEVSNEKAGETNDKFFLDDCSEAVLYNYGYLAYWKLWKDFDMNNIVSVAQSNSKISYPFSMTVFLMVIQHLLEPRSKLSTYRHQNRYFNMEEIRLHHMYRALDKLAKWKDYIESELFEHNYIRLQKKVDVVFYDVTTFAFESVTADELRGFGFSKACKFNEVQVVMGMIIDADGMPVGYELFPGNTFEGKTMVKVLDNIKDRFGIDRVIIVADRGLNSKSNLNLIKEAGYGYIMASKIKGMSKAMQEKILCPKGFFTVNDKSGNELFRYKSIDYLNIFTDEDKQQHRLQEKLIISYSAKRAKKDHKDRERLVEKAKKLLEKPETIKALNKRGGKKYIEQKNTQNKETWELSTEKIEKDAKFDGYYGIQTSEKNMSEQDVIDAYHTLWKIEESFRIMKSTLEARPIFHWTKSRIEGHFVVCFLAFLLERKMEHILKSEPDENVSSAQRIQEALNGMQLAEVSANNEVVLIRAKSDPLCNKIFKLLRIEMPATISRKSELVSRYELKDEAETVQLSFF